MKLSNILNNSVIRYLIVGGFLFLIDLSVFMTLTTFGLSLVYSQVVSRSVGAACGFILHKIYSFKNRDKNKKSMAVQGFSYTALTLINIAISPFVVLFFEYLIDFSMVLVKIMTEIVMVTETYIVLKYIFCHNQKDCKSE